MSDTNKKVTIWDAESWRIYKRLLGYTRRYWIVGLISLVGMLGSKTFTFGPRSGRGAADAPPAPISSAHSASADSETTFEPIGGLPSRRLLQRLLRPRLPGPDRAHSGPRQPVDYGFTVPPTVVSTEIEVTGGGV